MQVFIILKYSEKVWSQWNQFPLRPSFPSINLYIIKFWHFRINRVPLNTFQNLLSSIKKIYFILHFRLSNALPASEENGGSIFPPGIHRELSLILKEIKVITDKIRDDDESTATENDWKFAAMVLDRLCLITFTLFTIIATFAVLAAAPHVIVT